MNEKQMLTVALAKGRMQQDALALLARAGVVVNEDEIRSRRLAIMDEQNRFRFVLVKPTDVPVYVEHGVADCGVVGHDVLAESDADVLQPLDLGIAACRLVVAARVGERLEDAVVLRVATKYPRLAAKHFAGRGIAVEVIKLAGSVELAPSLDLADCIVDLVETGRTLLENDLQIVETILTSSGRLCVNRASYQMKPQVKELIEMFGRVANKVQNQAAVSV